METHNEKADADGAARRTQLRQEMIRETERYINQRLHRGTPPWPGREPSQNGRELASGKTEPSVDGAKPRVVTRSAVTFVVIVRDGEEGGFDNATAAQLVERLGWLLDHAETRHVIVDVSELGSMTAQLLNILAAFQGRFSRAQRQFAIKATNAQAVGILKMAGLGHLVDSTK